MTVEELIETLIDMPLDAEVYVVTSHEEPVGELREDDPVVVKGRGGVFLTVKSDLGWVLWDYGLKENACCTRIKENTTEW